MALDSPPAEDRITEILTLHPERSQKNLRLDRFVADALPEMSRNYLQRLIEDGHVLVDGIVRRQSFKMTSGQVVTVAIPEDETFDLVAEDIPLAVLFEDDDVLVIDKPAGLVVHPAPGHPTGTLVNAVLFHAPAISIGGGNRPGIVHRLDKDTSGVMVVAKTDRAHTSLVEQWPTGSVTKRYVALVGGKIAEDEATIDAPIARDPANRMRMAPVRTGKHAVSHFRVSERHARSTLIDVTIDTGRTHQIRVHLAMINHAVVGDALYGTSSTRTIAHQIGLERQFLHAAQLGFELPGGEAVTFEAPLPADLAAALQVASTGSPPT